MRRLKKLPLEYNDDFDVFDKHKFYKAIFSIGLPVVLQQLLSNTLNLVDTVMVGKLGELDVAAVAIANKITMIYFLVGFGLTSGLNVFVAQYFGANDKRNIQRLEGLMLTLVFGFSIIYSIVSYVFAPQLINLFVSDTPEIVSYVITQGSDYLKIICFSLAFSGMSFALQMLCRGIRRTKIPLVAVAVAISTNTLLNYILIFGNFGAPALGVKGAAIATVIARTVEFILMVFFIFGIRSDNPLKCKFKYLFDWNKEFVSKVLKTSLPVVANETFWSLAQTYYIALIGVLGASSVAVIQISNTIYTVLWSFFMGVASSCAVMVGNAIGAKELNNAKEYSKRFLIISSIMAVVLGILLVVLRYPLMSLFTLDADTVGVMSKTLIVTALTMGFGMMNNIFIVGLFRSGGDTKFCMWVEIISLWLIGIPAVYVGVNYFRVPVYVAAALLQSDNIVKMIVSLFRYRSGKWIRRVID